MTISYEVGADAALVLKFGDADQSVVKGLNTIQLPGLERNIITVQEFRNALSRQFAGGGTLGNINFGGNYVLGDTLGQDQLKVYWLANTKFTDGRVYINLTDFLACDLAQDSISSMQVTKVDPGQADKNGIFPYSGTIIMNGRPAIYTAHIEDAATPTITFVAGSPQTIVDSESGFVTAGFVAGQSIIVEGGTNADAVAIIDTVAAGTLTLTTAGGIVVDAGGSADTVIHGGLL